MQIDGLTDQVQIRSGLGVRIDGVNRTSAFGQGWTVTHDAEAAFASASLPVIEPFTLSSGHHTIAVYAGWQGDTSQPVFVGEIVNAAETYYPHLSTLTAGGYLKRTDVGLDVQIGYYYGGGTSGETAAVIAKIPAGYEQIPIATDADLIINIVEHYGITPSSTGHHIEASDWIPAKLTPILWDIGTSGWRIIQELDAIADYATSDGRLGQVLRKQVFGTVPASVRHTFSQGVDILDLRLSTAYEAHNQVKVTGASDPSDPDLAPIVGIAPAGAPFPSPYIPDPPGVRTDESLSSPYIETAADATSIADRRLSRLYQPLQEITLTTLGCADLDIDDGVAVHADVLGLSTNAFIVTHQIGGDPFRSTLTLRGSTAADTRDNAPPTPQMIISVILEHVIISGTVTPLAMITVDARASSDPDGTIAAWTIALDGATYSGTAIGAALISHASTAPSPIPVTLTVTDTDGLSASLTQAATWDTATVLIEPLVTAEAVLGASSSDGELTWQTFAAPVSAVAPIALGGTVLYGCTDGKLYRSTDLLASVPILRHTFPAGVSCLWCNEQAPTRWLAGLTSGALWISIDDGATWTLLWTFLDPVNDVSESPAAPGEITVASGHSLWHTYDAGHVWNILVTGGGTALRFAAAHFAGVDKAFVGFDDGGILSTTGDSLTLPTPAAIRGLTISLDATELFILTDSPATYSYTVAGGLVSGPPTGTATNRAIRSGAGQWIYAATDGALQKLLPHETVYDVRLMTAPQRSLAVGYGSLRIAPPPALPPVGPLEVYLPTNASSTLGGVWHYVPGAGWSRLTSGLPTGPIWWRWIAADPSNPNMLAVVGQGIMVGYPEEYVVDTIAHKVTMNANGTAVSPVWVSSDAGATWHEAECRAPNEATGRCFGFYQVEFSKTTPGRWSVVGRTNTAAGLRVTRWQGDMTTPRAAWIDMDFSHDFEWLHPGDDEDTLTSFHDGANQIVYVPTPPTAHTTGLLETVDERVIPRPAGPEKVNMDTLYGTRSLFGLEGLRADGDRLWYVDDYRTNTIYLTDQVFPRSSGASAGWVTCTHDAAYVSQGDGTYEIRITGPALPYGWKAIATKVLAAEKVYQIRSDRQSQRVMVGRSSGDANKIVVYDGTAWGTFAAPPEATPNFDGCIEVVTRPGGG